MTEAKKGILSDRVNQISELREQGINPYPDRFEKTHSLKEAFELEEGTAGVRIAGRVISNRPMGKLGFAHIRDAEAKIQVCFTVDNLDKDRFKFYKKFVDIGDFVGLEGELFVTKKGEQTLMVKAFQLLAKAIRALPEKWHGLTDQETRYRQRYLDLIMNEDTRKRFEVRASVIREIRRYLEDNHFIEVETPILQTKPSGALAKPFITHHNAFDIDATLRIAPETYLKRLIVGGYDRVFEFAQCFRNEGVSQEHLQEFLMLEYYAAYWNYEDNMNFTEKLVQHTLEKVLGTLTLEFQGRSIDFSGAWKRRSFQQLILEDCGIDIYQNRTRDELLSAMEEKDIQLENVKIDNLGWGALVDALYKKVSRPKIDSPVFLTSHPIELSPLARANDEDPTITDRFQLVVAGMEICNAYSELVDPIDQAERFQQQQALRDAGDDEALPADDDYVHCMEYGMPPISGWGMGIDRFVALITDEENIKNTVYFPLMKPLHHEENEDG